MKTCADCADIGCDNQGISAMEACDLFTSSPLGEEVDPVREDILELLDRVGWLEQDLAELRDAFESVVAAIIRAAEGRSK